jgi:hypothetical protein
VSYDACQRPTCSTIGLKLRCIWSTPTLMAWTRLKCLLCFASTGSKSPEKAILSQTNTLYYAQYAVIVSIALEPRLFGEFMKAYCT